MIELGHYAREGPLREVLGQPWLQGWNGVEGVALSYDERLVAEVERTLGGVFPASAQGTIEHSRQAAMILSQTADHWEEYSGEEVRGDIFPGFVVDRLARWWGQVVERSGHRKRSPIVVEVDAGKTFGHEARPEPATLRASQYNFRVRRSARARLQAAASGGRIEELGSRRSRYGTTGGFLIDDFSGQTWTLTAAHVCADQLAKARAMPWPQSTPFLRRNAAHLFGALGFRQYRTETCSPVWSSRPDVVPMPQCQFTAMPQTGGLDVALHAVEPKAGLHPVGIVNLADMSQLLDLTFCGVTSGLRRVAPSAYSLWHSYELDGEQVCIHDCVQIRLAERPYVRTDLSRGGDSGSWLLARGGTGLHWAGLLTGGDGDRAGVVPADRIVNAVESGLSVPVSAFV